MRLLNVCPFKVGDVVYFKLDSHRHTKIVRITHHVDSWILYWNGPHGGEHSWMVRKSSPDHSGIRLLKRGDE